MESSSLEELVERIPRKGMSKKCQKFLPFVFEKYFKGESVNKIKRGLNEKNEGFVDIIYRRIEDIKLKSLKLITSVMPRGHPNSLKEDTEFADVVIDYCINFGKLKREIYGVFKILDKVEQDSLKSKYQDKKSKIEESDVKINYALNSLARRPDFYLFVIDKILK